MTGPCPTRAAAALALLLAGTAAPAADRPLTAEEFDALSVGRTMHYSAYGEPYGVEQYLPGRRVLWAFVGAECKKGHWYEEAGNICFVYEDIPEPQCWTFFDTAQGLMARFRGDPAEEPLVAVEESREPLVCAGPDLGV